MGSHTMGLPADFACGRARMHQRFQRLQGQHRIAQHAVAHRRAAHNLGHGQTEQRTMLVNMKGKRILIRRQPAQGLKIKVDHIAELLAENLKK